MICDGFKALRDANRMIVLSLSVASDGLTVNDLMKQTGLNIHDVRGVLDALVQIDRVQFKRRLREERVWPDSEYEIVYRLVAE